MTKNFATYNELVDLVTRNDGVVTCEMWQLRDVHGAGKLGVHVVTNISAELARRGLGHQPKILPQNQYDKARVYQRGSNVGNIIIAARSVSEEADEILRRASSNDATSVLEKIRELVCD